MSDLDTELTSDNYPLVRPLSNDFDNDLLLSYHAIKPLADIYRIVSQFGRDRKCIFTGGMAIDLALKSRGGYIYSNFDIDFDFFSTQFHTDAFDLTKILMQSFEPQRLNAIGAMHPSTMRVRYNWQPVADITQVPQEIYEKIPTLTIPVKKSKPYIIVHPCFQMIDQHFSMSQMYANEPMMNILGRCKKDFQRYFKLAHYFDIGAELLAIVGATKKQPANTKKQPANTKTLITAFFDLLKTDKISNVCLGGETALEFWTNNVELHTPDTLVLYSNKPLEVRDAILKLDNKLTPTYTQRLLDKIPQFISMGPFEIHDITHLWIAAKLQKNVWYAAPHTIGSMFMTRATIHKSVADAKMYIKLHELLKSTIKNTDNPQKSAEILFCPTYFGSEKIAESRYNVVKRQCQAQSDDKKGPQLVPRNYYPANSSAPDYGFDPKKSELFDFNGVEISEKNFHTEETPKSCDSVLTKSQFFI